MRSRANAFYLEAFFKHPMIPGRGSCLFKTKDSKEKKDRTYNDLTLLQFKSRKIDQEGRWRQHLPSDVPKSGVWRMQKASPLQKQSRWVCAYQLRSHVVNICYDTYAYNYSNCTISKRIISLSHSLRTRLVVRKFRLRFLFPVLLRYSIHAA